MRLRIISELSEPRPDQETILATLSNVYASAMVDEMLFKETYPFIFISNDNSGKQLYVGGNHEHHKDIEKKYPDKYDQFQEARYGNGYKEIHGYDSDNAVGRVGINVDDAESLRDRFLMPIAGLNIEVIAFYPSSHRQAVKPCVDRLIADRIVGPSAYIIYGSQITQSHGEETQNLKDTTDEEKERGMLQMAVHLGTWPDGRRMTATEKFALQKQLGMRTAPVVKKGMQKSMEKNKFTIPGQRWWAATSESK